MADAASRIIGSIKLLNPGLDTSGILEDVIGVPVGTEIDGLDQRINIVKRMFDGDFDPTRTEEEIVKIAATRGKTKDPGKYAAGLLSVRCATAPQGMRISAGAVAATSDRLYQYRVTATLEPTTAEIQASWNPAIGLYEFFLNIQAIQVGSAQNIAATRIRQIDAALPGGAYVINTESISGGKDPETLEELWTRYQEAVTQTDQSNRAGLKAKLIQQDPVNLKDVFIRNDMAPANPKGATKPVLNIFAIGEVIEAFSESLLVQPGGYVNLTHGYVSEISSILRGTEQVALYQLQTETGRRLNIKEAYTEGETLIVNYRYNSMLEKLQAYATSVSTDLFGYTASVRAGTPEDISLDLTVRAQSGILGSNGEANVRSMILNYFNSIYFSDSDINQTDVTGLLKNALAGIVSAKINVLEIINRTNQLTGFPVYIAPPKHVRLLDANLKVSVVAG